MTKFDGERFKTQLKLAKCRLENLLKKHRNTSGGRRREIANLLQQGLEDRARVNVPRLALPRPPLHVLGQIPDQR